jgi:hypothetical protein
VSERWQIEPEPSEEELAALTAALVVATTVHIEPEPAAPLVSAWRRAARREAVHATDDGRWSDRS